MATPRTTKTSGKKTTIPPKPNAAQQIAKLDQFVTSGAIEETSSIAATPTTTTTELVIENTTEISEKAKMKRLTLDISEDLHKAIKMKSVSLGIPMVDMLRTLLESNYRNQ
jgi:hypothetical protein